MLHRLSRHFSGVPGLYLIGAGLWLWLHASLLLWLWQVSVAHPSYRVNLVLLMIVIALLVHSSLRLSASTGVVRTTVQSWLFSLTSLVRRVSACTPSLRPAPLALFLGASLSYVASDHFLQVHTLSALLGGLSTYGLLGLYLSPRSWRRGLPAAFLLIALLPFGAHANTYIGLWARLFTAQVVHALLQAQHVASLSAQTILVLENGVAHIDVPCSGIRSLWAGTILYLGATWIERRPINLRWALWGAILLALLLCANIVRVYVIVTLAVVHKAPQLAEVLHEPMGVLGFLFASAAAYMGCRGGLYRTSAPSLVIEIEQPQDATPRWLGPALLCFLAALGTVHALRPLPPATPRPLSLALPAALDPQPAELSTGEQGLFSRLDAQAQKWRFHYQGLSGSLIAVSTTSWRAQHPPELCLSAAGHRPFRIDTLAVEPGFPVRRLWLSHPQHGARSAMYFFQSRKRTTADFVTRVVGSLPLFGNERRWVMVSILFDQIVPDESEQAHALLRRIHGAIGASLQDTQGVSP